MEHFGCCKVLSLGSLVIALNFRSEGSPAQRARSFASLYFSGNSFGKLEEVSLEIET